MIYAFMVGEIHMALTKGMWLLKRVSNPNDFPQAVERIVREDPDLRDKYDVASVTWDFDGGGGYSVRPTTGRPFALATRRLRSHPSTSRMSTTLFSFITPPCTERLTACPPPAA